LCNAVLSIGVILPALFLAICRSKSASEATFGVSSCGSNPSSDVVEYGNASLHLRALLALSYDLMCRRSPNMGWLCPVYTGCTLLVWWRNGRLPLSCGAKTECTIAPRTSSNDHSTCSCSVDCDMLLRLPSNASPPAGCAVVMKWRLGLRRGSACGSGVAP
jgi:hypothetical protein